MPASDDSAQVNWGLSASTAGSAAPVHGTNNLQAAIDRFDSAVSKLAGLYDKAAGQAGSLSGTSMSSSGLIPASGGTGSGGGFVGQLNSIFGNVRTGYSQSLPPQQTGNGGNGRGQGGLKSASQGGGGFIGMHSSPMAQIAVGAGMVGGAFAAAGASSFNNQVQMSGFVTQQMGWLPAGQSNSAVKQRIMNGAFSNNAVAFGQSDAAGGASIVSSMSGSASGYGNAASQAYGAAAGQFGYATGQGFTAGAQMAQATYSRSTSMNAMMMGLGNASALKLGGGQRGLSQQSQALMQGIFQGRSKISAKAFGTSFNSVTGVGYADLLNLYGGNAQMASDRVTQLQDYNKLANAGYSASQQTTLFANAAANKGGAQGILSKLGINESDQQRINNLTSTKTSRTADLANGYNAGLTQSIDLLTKFNNALNVFLKLPGVSTAVGYGQGLLGTAKKLGNLGGPADVGGAGLIAMTRGIYSMFGKGGAPDIGTGPTGSGGGGGGGGNSPLQALNANTAALDALTQALYGLEGKGGLKPGGNRGTAGKSGGRTAGRHRAGGNLSGVGSDAGHIAGGLAGEVITGGPEDPLSWIAAPALAWAGGQIGGAIGSHFAAGGVVDGSDMGHDSKTVKVRGGEGILVPAAVRGIGGRKAIDAINRKYGGGKKNQRHHYAHGGTVTGNEIDQYAEQFVGRTPYVWGGDSSSTGWDCSGMARSVYEHFGLATGMPRTSQAQWDWVKKTNKPEAGGLAFFAGSDGSQSSPGHVGIITGPNSMVDAYDTASGTMNNAIRGSSGPITGYGIPPKGFTSSGPGNGTSGNNSTAKSSSGSAQAVSGISLGLDPGSYGSSNEVDTILAALAGGGGSLSAGGNAAASSGASASSVKAVAGGSTISMKGITNASGVAALKAAAAKMGWTGAQWSALQGVEAIEDSGYSLTAQNPHSDAYGMAQFINGASEYKQYGGNSTTYAGQATGMVNYIKQRYGTPEKALAHEHAFGNYAGGTNSASGGLSWVGERGPELMALPAGTKVATNAAARNYAKGTAQTPWSAKLAGIPSGGTHMGACQGHTVQVTFGDINIGSGTSGSPNSMAQNGREFIRVVKQQMEQEDMFSNIAAGVK